MTTPHASHISRTAYVLFIWAERKKDSRDPGDRMDMIFSVAKGNRHATMKRAAGPVSPVPTPPRIRYTGSPRPAPSCISAASSVYRISGSVADQAAGLQESLRLLPGGGPIACSSCLDRPGRMTYGENGVLINRQRSLHSCRRGRIFGAIPTFCGFIGEQA